MLNSRSIPYHVSEITFPADVTPCIIYEHTQETNLLLDFLTHTINFRQTPQDTQKHVMESFRSCVEKKGDKYFFQSVCDTLIITKWNDNINGLMIPFQLNFIMISFNIVDKLPLSPGTINHALAQGVTTWRHHGGILDNPYLKIVLTCNEVLDSLMFNMVSGPV